MQISSEKKAAIEFYGHLEVHTAENKGRARV